MFDDFRSFIEELDKKGELKKVEGADWDLETGPITELFAERKGPALLFDGVKGYAKGYKVASNLVITPRRQRIALTHCARPSRSRLVVCSRAWRSIRLESNRNHGSSRQVARPNLALR